MPYLQDLAARAGAAKLRSLSVTAALAPEDGDLWAALAPAPLEVGETVSDCALRAAREAGHPGTLTPRACLGVRSDPLQVRAGPGALRRQDIEVAVWMVPARGTARPRGMAAPSRAWAASALAEFRRSGRPRFDGIGASGAPVPDSYSAETYWRRLRRSVAHAPLIMPAVAALVFDDRGKLLLVRTRTWDRWMIPGGSVEWGETTADTAARKVREETGLAVEPYALLGAYSGPAFLARYPNGDVTQHVSTPMLCRVAGGTLAPAVAEILEVRAFGGDALPRMFPQWERIARDAFAGTLGHVQ